MSASSRKPPVANGSYRPEPDIGVGIAERSHPNVAAIALANKTARMAWAMLRNDTDYQPDRAAA